MIEALKQGGYVIYFRHGATTKTGEKTVRAEDLDNCAVQRNLSNAGRSQTKTIGSVFNQLQIPVGTVYSSLYCRCMDTAKNIFGRAEKSDVLYCAIHTTKSMWKEIAVRLRDMLATPPRRGTNTAIVSHTVNLREAADIWPKPEGVAHIFKPEGRGEFSYVGMVLPEEWVRLAPQLTAEGWLNSLKQEVVNLF